MRSTNVLVVSRTEVLDLSDMIYSLEWARRPGWVDRDRHEGECQARQASEASPDRSGTAHELPFKVTVLRVGNS